MAKANGVFISFLVIILLITSTIILTKPAMPAEAFQLYIATLLWHICGAILFLLAIKGFRPTLKPAYRFMSIGASMLLLGVIQISSLQALHLDTHPVAKILTELPFILMQTFFYIGIRTFAKILSVPSWLVNPYKAFISSAIGGVIAALIVIYFNLTPLFGDLFGLQIFNLLLIIDNTILAYYVWRSVSPFYKPAFRWFFSFFALNTFNTLCNLYQHIPGITLFAQTLVIQYLIAGFILSLTALQFNRVAYAEKSRAFMASKKNGKGPKTSVDLLTFLAGFASNPSAIDALLDPIRLVTSSPGYQGKPDESQQKTLASVYLKLEDYLIKNEPLRKFEQKDLRDMIELQFKDAVNEPTFWVHMPKAVASASPKG